MNISEFYKRSGLTKLSCVMLFLFLLIIGVSFFGVFTLNSKDPFFTKIAFKILGGLLVLLLPLTSVQFFLKGIRAIREKRLFVNHPAGSVLGNRIYSQESHRFNFYMWTVLFFILSAFFAFLSWYTLHEVLLLA